MNMTQEVHDFINRIKSIKGYSEIVDVITTDMEKFKVDVTNMILSNRVHVEGRWTDYILSDININYNEDVFRLKDLLEMYGVFGEFDIPLTAESKGLIISYQYTLYDKFNIPMDIVNLFHVTLINPDNTHNEWYLGNK